MKQKTKLFLITLAFFAAFAFWAKAAIVTCGGPSQPECQIIDIVYTVQRIINFLLAWAWLVTIFFILWSGWDMINSGGNQEAVTKAKAGLTQAIIGFFLVMASYLLINLIVGILTGSGDPRAGALGNILDFLR